MACHKNENGSTGAPDPLAAGALRRLLEGLFPEPPEGGGPRLEKLNGRVWRIWFETESGLRSVMVKRLAPEVARRNSMVLGRWLPAAGMSENGMVLLGAAADLAGDQVWHVYEDHGEWGLEARSRERERVAAATAAIARLHIRFADHPLLGECRQWGGDLGIHFYTSNVRDAARAVASLEAAGAGAPPDGAALKERLLARLGALLDEAPRRGKLLEEEGGPETLLHGDLWTKNVLVIGPESDLAVRLIDWDHAAVGPVSYDLSTFLYRFPRPERTWILEVYRGALAERGLGLPAAGDLNVLCETAELARIANRLIWPALAILDGEAWGWEELREVERWFDALEPLLPEDSSAP